MLYCSFMWVTLAGDLSRLQLLRKNAEVYVLPQYYCSLQKER